MGAIREVVFFFAFLLKGGLRRPEREVRPGILPEEKSSSEVGAAEPSEKVAEMSEGHS